MGKDREKKIILMKIFVFGLGILLLIIWSINFKFVWQENKKVSPINQDGFNTFSEEFNNSLEEMQQQFGSINNNENQKNLEKGQIILRDVLQGAKNISSSTNKALNNNTGATTSILVSSSTPISTSTPYLNNTNNCPEYVNCMPTIGVDRPCQIPIGCEGKTNIAY